MYREYSVMQPLQRSYAITLERIDTLASSGALNTLYNPAKVAELQGAEELKSLLRRRPLQEDARYQNWCRDTFYPLFLQIPGAEVKRRTRC